MTIRVPKDNFDEQTFKSLIFEFRNLQMALQTIIGDLPDKWSQTAVEMKKMMTSRNFESTILLEFRKSIAEVKASVAKALRLGERLPKDTIRDILEEYSIKFSSSKIGGSGFAQLKEIESALLKNRMTAHSAKILNNEEFEVVVHRPSISRVSVVESGLIGLAQSGLSMAETSSLNPSYYKAMREEAEARYLGLEVSTYRSLLIESRPKYGLLRLKWNFPDAPKSTLANDYGDDVYILKNDKIRTRTTFTLGDSLDRLRYRDDVPKKSPLENDLRDFTKFSTTTWDQSLIPWSHRILLAFEAHLSLNSNAELSVPFMIRPSEFQKQLLLDKETPLNKYTRSNVNNFLTGNQPMWVNGSEYIEAQIFGPLDLNHVAIFEFRKTPPSGNFLIALKAHQILILDGRGTKAIPWASNSN